jgi:hydroxymethylglutaryl-CoA lyase
MQNMAYPKRVTIYEVGPRDGLQNEASPVATDIKVALIDKLSASGISHIEAGSFVSPKWVPQMAGSAEVMGAISRQPGVAYWALTPNLKGFDAALAANSDGAAVFAAASESFSQKNINCSIDESLERFRPVLQAASAAAMPVRAYISCALGCPYEGAVEPGRVAQLAEKLLAMGCAEISLGDTIGAGAPETARAMLEAVVGAVPLHALAVHFHDTKGQAVANVRVALEMGVSVVDSAVGGLGGCPYAPGAAGNVATEDILGLLDALGIESGVDGLAVAEAGQYILAALNQRQGEQP